MKKKVRRWRRRRRKRRKKRRKTVQNGVVSYRRACVCVGRGAVILKVLHFLKKHARTFWVK